MIDETDILRRFGVLTTPSADAAARIRERLLASGVLAGGLGVVLGKLPTPRTGVQRRLAHRLAWRRRRPRLVALATAALVLVGVGITWIRQPRLLDEPLRSPVQTEPARMAPGVSLSYQGDGWLSGTTRAPVISLNEGTIRVEYDGGGTLRVETQEAEVEVVGTRFSVSHNALGTQVEVVEGRVRVACRVEGTSLVEAGTSSTCGSSSLLLKRARNLEGQDWEGALANAARGLVLARRDDPRGELMAVRLESLEALGRPAEALTLAEACVAAPDTCLGDDRFRETEIRRAAARFALALGGCDRARSHIEILASRFPPDPSDVEMLARCDGR